MKFWLKAVLVLSGIVILLVVGAVLVVFRGASRLDIAEEVPAAPIVVSLELPENRRISVSHRPIEVQASFIGEAPLSGLEFWVDGVLLEEIPVDDGRLAWEWTPSEPGGHSVVVRAIDEQGRAQYSNAVPVEVVEPSGGVAMRTYTSGPGETVSEIAEAAGLSPADILAYNLLPPEETLPPGTILLIPEKPLETSPPASQARVPAPDAPEFTGNRVATWLSLNLPLLAPAVPAAPDLSAAVSGCSVNLSIDPVEGALGYSVYRLTPGQSAFLPIVHLGAGTTNFTDSDVAGDVQYYAAAFNAAGEAPGGIVPVGISDPACGVPAAVQTDPTITNGILQTSQSAAAVYLYTSVDGVDWQRVPAAEGTFIGGGGVFNLQPYLPAGSGSFLYEAWGWSGGALVFLGAGGTAGKAVLSGSLLNLPIDTTRLDILNSNLDPNVAVKVQDYSLEWNASLSKFNVEFQWTTESSAAEGLWQVSIVPFPYSTDIEPPGLVAEGKADAASIYFKIDFSKIVSPPVQGAATQTPSGSGGGFAASDPFASAPLDLNVNESIIPPEKASVPIDTYYVRILPMSGSKLAGFPSNSVTVHYGPPVENEPIQLAGVMQPLYEVRIVDFDPGGFPDPNRWGCVVIVDDADVPPLFPEYDVGEVVCPTKLPGQKNQLVEFVETIGGAYDWAAGKINSLKAKVVDFIGEQACGSADSAFGGLGVISKDDCKAAVAIAADVALAAYGVPPSLPNFEQLTEQGKDYLVEVAAEELESNGIPCPDECRDLIRDGINAGIEIAANQSAEPGCVSKEEAAEHGLKPLCLDQYGYVVKPASGAAYIDPVVTLEVTRIPGVEPPSWFSSCQAQVEMHVSRTYIDAYGTKELNEVLYGASAKLVGMAPGQIMTIPLALDPKNAWLDFDWFKAPNEEYGVNPPTPYGLSLEWFLVYNGGTANLQVKDQFSSSANGECLVPANSWTEALP